ncbi:Uncharacterised protein [Mycobacterium tuberculosis]|nr:Uncharacterised protein [Mycobacterium tuberculosis]CNV57952.1 Uncharacterised protein [Mycobacterium tuberculosis]
MSSGPSTRGPNRSDQSNAIDTGIATRKTIAEAPSSPLPSSQRGNSMKLAPRNAETAPDAMATEFIVTTCSRGTTWGSAADSPEATNRAKPLATSAPTNSGTSPAPTASIVPTPAIRASRPVLAPTSTHRRSHRSIRAPAKGPSSE